MKRHGILLFAVAILATTVSTAQATDLYWDINGTDDGASGGTTAVGNWNTGLTANWNTDSTGGAGGTITTWTDGDNAFFSAGTNASGTFTVTPVGTVTVGNITVEDTAVGNTFTFSATGSPTLFFNSGAVFTISNAATVTMNSSIAGTGGLIKEGPGRLTIGTGANTNILDGTYEIRGGSISANSDDKFGPVPGAVDPDYFLLNGGAIRYGASFTLHTNRGITLGVNGGKLAAANNFTLTYDGVISGTSGGALIIDRNDGVGTPAGTAVVRLGGANTYDGETTINGNAQLQINSNVGVIPDTSVVNLTAAAAQLQLNGFDETIKSVKGTAGVVALGSNTLTIDNPAGEVYESVISSTTDGKFVKNGSGALTLKGGSTGFNGEVVLNAGTLGVGGANIFGGASNTGKLVINGSGAILANDGTAGRAIPAAIGLIINTDFTVDNSLAASPGQIVFNNTNITSFGGDRTITVNGANTNLVLFSFKEDQAGSKLIKEGDGVLALTPTTVDGVNYTGDTIINGGRLRISGNANSRVADGNSRIFLSGGGLEVNSNGRAVSNPVTNPLTIDDDSYITTSNTNGPVDADAGAANFVFSTSDIQTTGGSLTFRHEGPSSIGTGLNVPFEPRFTGSGFDITIPMAIENNALIGTLTNAVTRFRSMNVTGTQTYSGVISGDGSFIRSSSAGGSTGEAVLTGDNQYSGGTRINDGILRVNNTSGSGTGSGPVQVGVNSAVPGPFVGTLAGAGTISGVVTVNHDGVVSPGNSTGTLTVGGLVLNAGTNPGDRATLNFELGSIAGSDLIDVTMLDGLTINDATFNITNVAGFGAGTYTLIDYDGALQGTGTVDNNMLGTTPGGFTYNLFNNVGASAIQLTVIGAGADFAGDFNDDGAVDAADYVMWRHAETNSTFVLQNDTATPGFQAADYDVWTANFGNEDGGGSNEGRGTVPEPTALALAMLGLSLVGMSRRRG